MTKASKKTASKKGKRSTAVSGQKAVSVQQGLTADIPKSKVAPKAPQITPAKPKSQAGRTDAARPKLPSAIHLLRTSLGVLRRNWKVFLGITLVYLVLNILFVQSFSNVSVDSTKTSLDHLFGASGASRTAAAGALFAYMIGSVGSSSSAAGGVYQLVFVLVTSLAAIWALRQIYTGTTTLRIRDAFYNGMTPLVPFALIFLVVCLQLLPFIIGAAVYSTVMSNGIAVHALEKIFWVAVLAGLALWSLYLTSVSVMGMYVVAEPGMTPSRARRKARELVRKRRWQVMRKVVFLPAALLLFVGVVMVPAILVLTPLASTIFFLMLMSALVFVHSYMFALYQELAR